MISNIFRAKVNNMHCWWTETHPIA